MYSNIECKSHQWRRSCSLAFITFVFAAGWVNDTLYVTASCTSTTSRRRPFRVEMLGMVPVLIEEWLYTRPSGSHGVTAHNIRVRSGYSHCHRRSLYFVAL